MPNPFTRFLLQGSKHDRLHEFVLKWDHLEALCVETFKTKTFSESDAAAWKILRKKVAREYEYFEAALQPFWRATMIKGHYVQKDPFRWILSTTELSEIPENWGLMQRLPAAREALNQFILSKSG